MDVLPPLISVTVILTDLSTVSLVHVLMFFSQAVCCLPLLHLSSTASCIISFPGNSLVFLMIWPQYATFLAFTKSNNSHVVPAVFRTYSFVFFAVQETCRILPSPFISKPFSFILSECPTVSCTLLLATEELSLVVTWLRPVCCNLSILSAAIPNWLHSA